MNDYLQFALIGFSIGVGAFALVLLLALVLLTIIGLKERSEGGGYLE